MERPQPAEYNSRHGVQAARVSSEGSGREGKSSPHRLESWAALALPSQGDLSVRRVASGVIGIWRARLDWHRQACAGRWLCTGCGPTCVCERVRVCPSVYAPGQI